METEKDTKQTLPDHVIEYIATIYAFDALCKALIEVAVDFTEGKKEKKLVISLENYLGDVWGSTLLENDIGGDSYYNRDKADLEEIVSVLISDETIKEFIDVGISTCQDTIEESFADLCEKVYSRFSQIVELVEKDTYSSTLSADLEEYDVIVTVLASGLLIRSYLEAMREKFYGQSDYPEDFLDVQKETWKGLHWLEEPRNQFILGETRQLAIMCRHIQPLSIVRGMQHVYHSLPNLLKAHIGGVDIYIDDLVAEKIEDLEYLECLLTLENEAAKNWFHSQQKTLISNRLAELLGKRIIINTPDMSEAILDAGQIPYCLSIEETLEYLESRQEGTLYLRMFQVLELFLEQVLFFSMKYPADMLTEHILSGGDDKEEDWKAIRDLQDAVEEPTDVVDLFESIMLGTYQPSHKENSDIVDYTENDTDSNSDAECDNYDNLMNFSDNDEDEGSIDLLDTNTVESIREFFADLYEEYQESRNVFYESSDFDTFIMDSTYIKQLEYVGGSDVTSYFKVEIDGDYYNTYYNYGRVYVRDQNDPVNFDADWKTEEENGEPIRARIKESEKIYLYRVSYDFIYSIMKDMIEYALSSFEDIYRDGDLIRKARELIREEWKRVGNKGWRAKSPVEINLKVYKKMFENIGTILMNLVGNLKPKHLEDLKDSLEEKTIDEQILAGVMGLAKLMYPMFILMVQSDVNSVLDEGYDMYIEIPEDTSTEDLLYTLYLALYAFGSYRTSLTEERWFSNLKSKIDAYHPLKKIEVYIQNAMEGTLESWSTLRELYTYIKYEWEEPSTYCINLKYQLLNDTDDLTDDEYDSYNAIFHAYEGSQAGLERMVRCFMALYPVVLEIEAYQM